MFFWIVKGEGRGGRNQEMVLAFGLTTEAAPVAVEGIPLFPLEN
jgi:glycerate-2-kinase